LKITEDAFDDATSEVIFFQQKPVLKEVIEMSEALVERIYGLRRKSVRIRVTMRVRRRIEN
jgi:hypothetical protein